MDERIRDVGNCPTKSSTAIDIQRPVCCARRSGRAISVRLAGCSGCADVVYRLRRRLDCISPRGAAVCSKEKLDRRSNDDFMDTVLECHGRLAALLGSGAESVDVLRRAEEHRWYRRPGRVKVVLLAESHVYTTPEELARTISLPASAPPDLPRGFVRLVYCLGYGENRLLNRPIESPANTGTPQFWKIFYSCANATAINSDFAPIQTSATSPTQRILNKLVLLRRLRELGVWLLDTSLAALYLPGRPKTDPATLEACCRSAGTVTCVMWSRPRLRLILSALARGWHELSESGSRMSVCE